MLTTGLEGAGHRVINWLPAVVGVVLAPEGEGIDHLHVSQSGGTEETDEEGGGAHFGKLSRCF